EGVNLKEAPMLEETLIKWREQLRREGEAQGMQKLILQQMTQPGRRGGGSPPLLHRPLRPPRALLRNPPRLVLRSLALRPRPARQLDDLGLAARSAGGGVWGGAPALTL